MPSGKFEPIKIFDVSFRSMAQLCKVLGHYSQSRPSAEKQFGSLEAMAAQLTGLQDATAIAAELKRRLDRMGYGLAPQAPVLSDEERLLCKALMLEGLKSFDLVYFNNFTQSAISSKQALAAINTACKLI